MEESNASSIIQICLSVLDEIETNQKLYWDVRISVLGLKSKIMSLTGEVEQLQKDAHSSEASSAAAKEIDEVGVASSSRNDNFIASILVTSCEGRLKNLAVRKILLKLVIHN